ncbi:MAG: glycosyltransferase family 1 protein [Ferruginibacter sp.]
MTIGIEAQRLFRRKKHGMEIVALEIIRQLQQMDQQNQYILFARKDEDDECIKPSSNLKVEQMTAKSFPTWEQFNLPRAAKKNKVQLLHCTANTAPLFCKIPMVITIHDLIYLESVNFSGSSYQNFGNLYRRYIVPKVAKKAKMIITVSEYEKKNIAKRLKLSEDKIQVVYNGVNPQFAPVNDQQKINEVKTKHQLPEKFLLHFGNTAPRKNTLGVLKAHKIYTEKISGALPLVITSTTHEFIQKLLNEIGAPELINNIKILDYLVAGDLPCLYNMAEVFLYPSYKEGFGMPLVEAMACGTPVITSNTSAMPEVAGAAACLVNPDDANEIFNAIQCLLTNQVLYNEKRELGFKNAQRFSWKHAAEQTLAIYNQLK